MPISEAGTDMGYVVFEIEEFVYYTAGEEAAEREEEERAELARIEAEAEAERIAFEKAEAERIAREEEERAEQARIEAEEAARLALERCEGIELVTFKQKQGVVQGVHDGTGNRPHDVYLKVITDVDDYKTNYVLDTQNPVWPEADQVEFKASPNS
jgi:hypothetical protein